MCELNKYVAFSVFEEASLTQQNTLQRVKRRNHYTQPYQLSVCII